MTILLLAALVGFCMPAGAQEEANPVDAPPADAGQPGEMRSKVMREEPLPVTVVSVSGPAERLAVDAEGKQTWQALKAGEQLSGESVIRTGFRAKVVLKFADRGEVTINSATKFGVKKFVKTGPTRAEARLGLKYGTIDAQVHKEAGDNDVQVATPVATLAVGGSGAGIGFGGDSGMGVQGKSGHWKGATPGGGQMIVGGGESTRTQGGGFVPSGQLGLMRQHVGIGGGFGGLTKTERRNILYLGSGRGITTFLTGIGSGAPTGSLGGARVPLSDRLHQDDHEREYEEEYQISPGPDNGY